MLAPVAQSGGLLLRLRGLALLLGRGRSLLLPSSGLALLSLGLLGGLGLFLGRGRRLLGGGLGGLAGTLGRGTAQLDAHEVLTDDNGVLLVGEKLLDDAGLGGVYGDIDLQETSVLGRGRGRGR